MTIVIEDLRKEIERDYVGFSPATTSVKPVHIANGLFRTVQRQLFHTGNINRFVISQTEKGKIPKGHELDRVYAELAEGGRLDASSVKPEDLSRLRVMLKKVVGADGAVFPGGMDSYTAGSSPFLSRDRIAQDGGELVGLWLGKCKSPLHSIINQALTEKGDLVTALATPLLEEERLQIYEPSDFNYDQLYFLNRRTMPASIKGLWKGLEVAAETLSEHLIKHPNKLVRLRLAVLYASFVLIRHLTTLETAYIADDANKIPAFLLDFSPNSNNPIARASQMTYKQACQSIGRFYAWAFGERLKHQYSTSEIRREKQPIYKNKETSTEIWKLALQEAKRDTKPFTVYGRALYDMMAMEAEANPIGYLRKLGLLSGCLYPPNRSTQRFMVQQDMLEMLVRGALSPSEGSISMEDLQKRFWDRYHIIVGGRAEDEEVLLESGIYQVDGDALNQNSLRFADALRQLNFARLLADGVFQIQGEI